MFGPRGCPGVAGFGAVSKDLAEVLVAADTYSVSHEPVLLTAELYGTLALCLHDEERGVGGLLHLRFADASGRPTDATDNTLSCVLIVLDRFKSAVFGACARREDVQARILAHAPSAQGGTEPSASLVDLIKADLADGGVACGAQTLRRREGVQVHFEPFAGRVWISGLERARADARRRRGL